jgi:transcriptional regulator with XRE-family HTH domain
MRELSREQIDYAVGRLEQLIQYRGVTQTQLESWSGVSQSKISRIVVSKSSEPTEAELRKLFQALGLRLSDILNETDLPTEEILGYMATPLTGLSQRADQELRRVVATIRDIASADHFGSPPFSVYWPGDHTHPLVHPDLPSEQVYLTDRSRASTFDFLVILCAAPSYGVGQENEIATQAGVPAIRLVPKSGLSRMMLGSFVHTRDIEFSGTLEAGLTLDRKRLDEALSEIRRLHFRHRALYRGMNDDEFGPRLRKLINERLGNYEQFADDVGVSLSYLNRLLQEPFTVSNPSARLLRRVAVLLDVSVGYLLGESVETDPIWVESNAAWRRWVDNATSADASIALKIRDDWRHDYGSIKKEQGSEKSLRKAVGLMREPDWDKAYQNAAKKDRSNEPQLF